ncbi:MULTISPECIES: cupin domain-containing protein [Kitasatospora]|uniref:Cupin type-2 domain-containing protein n=1 Tax=Kitasatospora setae (strain ATCC 33774 / DSM 43861 / JCM 3304 / KCC A-0304 / NBRC 14216 / KM-6054) TaxID=452652 RepID=E4N3E5_KITSK|nr:MULTISPECIES: cupin domain-containing protein [Kitasatospora]BAJ32679.1 hypothetical protein KSE_69200 [Kitasatospora setae KM-6054]
MSFCPPPPRATFAPSAAPCPDDTPAAPPPVPVAVLAAALVEGPLDLSSLVSLTAASRTLTVLRRLDLPPGGSTGWHYHPGPMVTLVASGLLTHVTAAGTHLWAAGSAFMEPAGSEHVHLGRNDHAAPLALFTLSFLPPGAPVAVDAPAPVWAVP